MDDTVIEFLHLEAVNYVLSKSKVINEDAKVDFIQVGPMYLL